MEFTTISEQEAFERFDRISKRFLDISGDEFIQIHSSGGFSFPNRLVERVLMLAPLSYLSAMNTKSDSNNE